MPGAVRDKSYSALTDAELVEAVRHRSVFELVRRSTSCHRVALSILRNQADAEDAVQTAMLNAFVHFGFQSRANFKSWLLRIVVNESLMLLRKKKHTRGHLTIASSTDSDSPALELRSLQHSGEIYYHGELVTSIASHIRKMPAMYRNVLSLYASEDGLEVHTISDQLEVTPSAANPLHRAKRELRYRLEPQLCTPTAPRQPA